MSDKVFFNQTGLRSKAAQRTRRLGRHHFALYRGHLDGLPLSDLADRYLVEGSHLRTAAATLRWIRTELAAQSRRHGRPELRRLAQIDLPEITPQERPTLEQWASDRGYEDFAYEELIGLYQEEFPDLEDRRSKRNRRLKVKQRELVHWLESVVELDPDPLDYIDAWLEPWIAKRLADHGLLRIIELTSLIGEHGVRWYTRVPGIGRELASRIVRWVQMNPSLGILPPLALLPRRSAAAQTHIDASHANWIVSDQLAPLANFRPPEELNGSIGNNRALARCQIEADNDYTAIQAWLRARYTRSAASRRLAQAQAERLMLWAILKQKKALSSLNTDDCVAFREFLLHPDSNWCGPRTEKWTKSWRPFRGPLTRSSQQTAIAYCQSLFSWLVDARYLDSNPWRLIERQQIEQTSPKSRALIGDQWEAISTYLVTLPSQFSTQRARLILALGYGLGLRIAELAGALVDDLYYRNIDGDDYWVLHVLGKGQKWREVPIPTWVLDIIVGYLHQRGQFISAASAALQHDPVRDRQRRTEAVHLITTEAGEPITTGRIHQIVTRIFQGASLWAENLDLRLRDILSQATAHWLRHSYGTRLDESGIQIRLIQEVMGHASVTTTMRYSNPTIKRMKEAFAMLDKKNGK